MDKIAMISHKRIERLDSLDSKVIVEHLNGLVDGINQIMDKLEEMENKKLEDLCGGCKHYPRENACINYKETADENN